MADERIRRQIAFLAAQMMYHRTETEYFTAKRKAARQLGVEYRHRPGDLPSNTEIRDQIQAMARMHEGPKRLETLRDMRLDALRLMRLLARFRPRLIGSVRTGHVRKGSDIDIHIFCDSLALVTDTLDELGFSTTSSTSESSSMARSGSFTHIHVHDCAQLRADALSRRQGRITSSRARSRARRSSGRRSPSWRRCCARSIRRSTWKPRSSGSRTGSTRSCSFACCSSRWKG